MAQDEHETTERIVTFWLNWCDGPQSTVDSQDDVDQGCQIIRSDPEYWDQHSMRSLADAVRNERA